MGAPLAGVGSGGQSRLHLCPGRASWMRDQHVVQCAERLTKGVMRGQGDVGARCSRGGGCPDAARRVGFPEEVTLGPTWQMEVGSGAGDGLHGAPRERWWHSGSQEESVRQDAES